MDFNEQYRFLKEQVPKYEDIWNYVLLRNESRLDEFASDSYDIIAPISEVLLRTHQLYQKKNFLISHEIWSSTEVKNRIEKYPDIEELIKDICDNGSNELANNLIMITATRSTQIFEMAKSHPNFNKDLSLALQTQQNHKIAVIVLSNEVTIIFSNKRNIEDMQTYYSMIPIVYPKEGLPTELIESFLALYNKNYQKICDNLNIIFEGIDISEIKLKVLEENLAMLFKNMNNTSALDENIRNLEAQLRNEYDFIASTITTIQQKQAQKLILLNTDTSEIVKIVMEYLQNNKLIDNFDIANNKLRVVVKTPIYFVNEEFLTKLFETSKSYIHDFESDARALLKEAFINKKIKLIVKAILDIDIAAIGSYNGNIRTFLDILHVKPLANVDGYTDALPHPHLVYHNCFGGNETHILKAAQNKDYIGLIAQSIAACQNLNFGDSVVCSRFLNDITRNFPNTKFILDEETNKQITYSEWRQWNNNETD